MAEGHDTSPRQQRCATRIERKKKTNGKEKNERANPRTNTKSSVSDEKKMKERECCTVTTKKRMHYIEKYIKNIQRRKNVRNDVIKFKEISRKETCELPQPVSHGMKEEIQITRIKVWKTFSNGIQLTNITFISSTSKIIFDKLMSGVLKTRNVIEKRDERTKINSNYEEYKKFRKEEWRNIRIEYEDSKG